MATYEFKCCGITQEVVVGMREQIPTPICAVCNGEMHRIYNAVGIVLKGKGFYATDKKA